MKNTITRTLVAAAAAGSLLAAPALSPTAQAAPAVSIVAKPGSHGAVVKTIQNDLSYLGYYSAGIGGDYLTNTTAAVKKFQAAAKLPVTGIVDSTTYRILRSTADAKRAAVAKARAAAAAKAKAAAAAKRAAAAKQAAWLQTVVAKPGDRNATVKALQANLARLGYLNQSQVLGIYGPATTAAVKKVQASYRSAQTGVTTRDLFNLIAARAAKVKPPVVAAGKLDPRCYVGRTICVDKTTQKMSWVVNGQVKGTWIVRVGRPSMPTRSGLWHVYLKSPNWFSTLYHVNMPYTQFFSGGEAVHYSSDFARNGYRSSGSHGCVNMKSLADAKWLYNQTRVGDRVVVYNS